MGRGLRSDGRFPKATPEPAPGLGRHDPPEATYREDCFWVGFRPRDLVARKRYVGAPGRISPSRAQPYAAHPAPNVRNGVAAVAFGPMLPRIRKGLAAASLGNSAGSRPHPHLWPDREFVGRFSQMRGHVENRSDSASKEAPC